MAGSRQQLAGRTTGEGWEQGWGDDWGVHEQEGWQWGHPPRDRHGMGDSWGHQWGGVGDRLWGSKGGKLKAVVWPWWGQAGTAVGQHGGMTCSNCEVTVWA